MPFSFDPVSVTVEIGFNSEPLDEPQSFTDVSNYVRNFDISRGRQLELSSFNAAVATVVLDNSDDRFTPQNGSGPYFGKIKPSKRLRIGVSYSGTTYYIFESDYSSTKLDNVYSPFFPGTIRLNYDRIKYLTNTFYYSRLHKKTKRNVYYPWGQTILLQHKIMTNRSDFSGYYFRASSFFDFPGLKETHSLRLNFN